MANKNPEHNNPGSDPVKDRMIHDLSNADRMIRTFENLSRSLPAMVFEVDPEGNLIFADQLAFRASRVTDGEFQAGKTNVLDLIVPDDLARLRLNLSTLFAADKEEMVEPLNGQSYRFRTIDGDMRVVRIYGVRIFEGDKVVSVKGVALDETDRLNAEYQLEESERRMAVLLHNLPGMVYRCLNTPAWPMDFVSEGARELTGYPAEDIQRGKKVLFGDLIHPDDVGRIWDIVQEAVAEDREFKMVYRLMHREHGWRYVWEQGQATGKTPEGVEILEGFITDITEKHEAQKKLVAAKERAEQSDRLKTAFLGNLSHELRTPLNTILGFSDLIAESNISDEQRKEYAAIVKRSGKQLLSLMNDLIDISMLETSQVRLYTKKISIAHLLKEVHRQYKSNADLAEGVEVVLSLGNISYDMQFELDDFRLRQVLNNLIDNAIRYTHKGQITLGCTGIREETDSLVVFVRDTGQGMPKENLPFIFDRFYQINEPGSSTQGGTGLGLAICKGYVGLMGGTIHVESEPGVGTEFIIEIPQPHALAEKFLSADIQEVVKDSDNRKSILIVEDDEPNMHFLESALQDLDINIIKVNNGNDAVDICRNNEQIDLVLLDIKLPGKDGLEVVKEIRGFNTGLPVVAQTAYAMKEDRESALSAGCTDYLSKPLTRDVLVKTVKKYLK